MMLSQSRPQAHHHLLGQIAEIEAALIRIIAVGGNLLERLDQFGGAIEIGHQLRRRIAAGFEKFIEARSPEIAARHFGGEHRRLAFQRRGHRQADADGIVDLMGDARHQPPERRELFGLDQRVLGLAQIAQRRFGGILGLAHLLLAALALADIERDGDDIFDLAVGIEQRQLVHQPMPHVAGGIQIFLFVEAEPAARLQHPLVVFVGLLRAVARHQVGWWCGRSRPPARSRKCRPCSGSSGRSAAPCP